jgi:hypothetical protein
MRKEKERPYLLVYVCTLKKARSEVVPSGPEIPWRVAGRQGKTLEFQAKKRQKCVCHGRKSGRCLAGRMDMKA